MTSAVNRCPICKGSGIVSLDRGHVFVTRAPATHRCLFCDGSGHLKQSAKEENVRKEKYAKLSDAEKEAVKAKQRVYDKKRHERERSLKQKDEPAKPIKQTQAVKTSEGGQPLTCRFCGGRLELYIEEGCGIVSCDQCKIEVKQSLITMRLLAENYAVFVHGVLSKISGMLGKNS